MEPAAREVDGRTGKATAVGDATSVVVPFPSSPLALLPQPTTLPSVRRARLE